MEQSGLSIVPRAIFQQLCSPCLKIMSRRIKASWLSQVETGRARWYSAWVYFYHFFSSDIVYYWCCLVPSLCVLCCAEIASCRFCANSAINMRAAFQPLAVKNVKNGILATSHRHRLNNSGTDVDIRNIPSVMSNVLQVLCFKWQV